MRPMELMALSVASCSSYDVVTILKKARQEILSCEAEVEAVRVDSVPQYLSLYICILKSLEWAWQKAK